jgi:hypothetical protein
MEQKRPNKRPQKLDTQGIRGLVFALAVSSTIGFWAIFSRVDAIQPSGADDLDPSSDGMSEVQDENVTVLDLPPIPTLIPATNTSFLSQPMTAMNIPVAITDGAGNRNQPLVSPPTAGNKPVRDLSKPEKPKRVKEKKTTSTRSS